MKQMLIALLLLSAASTSAQSPKLEKLWETEPVVKVPESVLAYDGGKKLYVSLIDGGGWDVDGKGGVAKLNSDGTDLNQDWVTGLNAPKGMALVGKRLYVADIKEVVVIDTRSGKILSKIAIDGATGLNDITSDKKGSIWVSDSRTGRIWKIENGIAKLHLENVKGVNGLKSIGENLFVGAGKSFQRVDSALKLVVLAEMPQGIDGIEPVGNGNFIVTSWSGFIFYVFADGRVEQLADLRSEKKNAADIGYDPRRRILYVPTFNGKTVAAYRLK